MSGIKLSLGSAHLSKGKAPVRKSAFSALGGDSDDEQEGFPTSSTTKKTNGLGQASSSKGKGPAGNAGLLKPPTGTTGLSRQERLKQEQAKKLDATVFEYDEVYDDMKEAERATKAAKDELGQERKPQYISGLMATAQQRQLDRQRAEDALVARERVAEGSEFADKDAFVTPAYLEQQEEFRRLEEEERRKAEKGPTNEGAARFYKGMLDDESKRHEAAMAAVAKKNAQKKAAAAAASGGGSLGLSALLADQSSSTNRQPQYDAEPEAAPSEAKVAEEASKKLGRKVELDDEGRIIDHRQLLTGGLNVGTKKGPLDNKSGNRGFAIPIAQRAKEDREKQAELAKAEMDAIGDDGLTRAEKIRMSRERQSRMLESQLVELEERKRKAEAEKAEEGVRKVQKRNDESKVDELKRKALERRKQREEMVKGAT